MKRASRISFAFIFLTLFFVGWLRLGTPLVAVLFSYFALNKLKFRRQKWIALSLFFILLLAIFYGFGTFLKQAFVALPDIVETSVPIVIAYARKHQLDLGFTDLDSLKTLVLHGVKEQLSYLGNFAKIATKESVFVVIGIVVAASMFVNTQLDLDRGRHAVKNNLYSLCCEEIGARFRSFYHSFARVMGAQILISGINTALTSIFLVWAALPYTGVVIVVTFFCGLLPIIGNLISNTIIVSIAISISPKLAVLSLAFLVILHKLEYFLNSKIIGERIKNPMWLTLLGLIIGERLMGIPGMILAPVILNYVKVEASKIEVFEVRETKSSHLELDEGFGAGRAGGGRSMEGGC